METSKKQRIAEKVTGIISIIITFAAIILAASQGKTAPISPYKLVLIAYSVGVVSLIIKNWNKKMTILRSFGKGIIIPILVIYDFFTADANHPDDNTLDDEDFRIPEYAIAFSAFGLIAALIFSIIGFFKG